MSEKLQKRSTYIGQIDRAPSGTYTHLRFVISDFIYDEIMGEECALVVNMTSLHGTSKDDKTCELKVGDHPDITGPSYIEYSMAERVPKSYILENVEKKHFVLRGLISPDLLKKIQDGVRVRKDDMPRFVEDYEDAF